MFSSNNLSLIPVDLLLSCALLIHRLLHSVSSSFDISFFDVFFRQSHFGLVFLIPLCFIFFPFLLCRRLQFVHCVCVFISERRFSTCREIAYFVFCLVELLGETWYVGHYFDTSRQSFSSGKLGPLVFIWKSSIYIMATSPTTLKPIPSRT